jgi:cytochrome P450
MNMPSWLPNPGMARVHGAVRSVRGCMKALIDRKRAEFAHGSPVTGDLISQLLAARDPETGESMSDVQLINNLLTIVEAGHESTASALTWTLYLLARSQTWQDLVRDEVVRVVGTGPIEARHLPLLVLTQQVFKEALRLYPPGSTIGRVFTGPLTIAGEHFEPGDVAMIPVYCIHRHRRLWADPALFDPDRFTPQREAALRRYQFMPFGIGGRACVGSAFAITEAQIVLATLIRAARYEWTDRREPEPVSRDTLRPRGGLRLSVTWL